MGGHAKYTNRELSVQTRHLTLCLLLIGVLVSATAGQGFRRGPNVARDGSGRLGSTGLKVGSPMPEVTVVDEQGAPFHTASLKGKYSVVVFGCLT